MTPTEHDHRIVEEAHDKLAKLMLAYDWDNHPTNVKAIILAAIAEAKKPLEEDGARLDWLLNITAPVRPHTAGWPYPDRRGTYGERFVGRVYYESCEARRQDEFFYDRAAIDAAREQEGKNRE